MYKGQSLCHCIPDIQFSYNFNSNFPLPHSTPYIKMFSKVLVKLTSVFVILYISSTSATPAGTVQNTNDDTALAPHDNSAYQCKQPYTWMQRECTDSPRGWRDVCTWSAAGTNLETKHDNKPGMCPEGTFCLNTLKKDNKHFSACISNQQSKGKQPLDPQAGTSYPIKAIKGIWNTHPQFSVTIDHDMTDASVSAVFKSECRTVNVHCHIFLCSCRESIGFR